MARVFPPAALRKGLSGAARITCEVTAKGGLTDCVSSDEEPIGYGFGDASVKLARYFQMEQTDGSGNPVVGRTFTTRIRFNLTTVSR
jgi:TonB family protein